LYVFCTATEQSNIDVCEFYCLIFVVFGYSREVWCIILSRTFAQQKHNIGVLYIIFLDVMRNGRADAFNNGLKEKLPRTIKHVLYYKTNAYILYSIPVRPSYMDDDIAAVEYRV